MMAAFGRYEETDKAALYNALLALRTCPNCRGDLRPVALFEDVWGCKPCRETWYVPDETRYSLSFDDDAPEWEGSLGEFLRDNPDTDPESIATMRNLAIGAEYLTGGGAAPLAILRRVR